jgi:hypothetical protein
MFNQGGQGGNFRNRINNIAQKFREAGATSATTAKTASELGLPPRFEQAMHRRLGQSGVFVEINGKYYLDEGRLAQFNQTGMGSWQGQRMGAYRGARETLFGLRIARMLIVLAIFLLGIANLFYFHSFDLWLVTGGLVIVAVIIFVMQIYYMFKVRRTRNLGNFP